MMKPGFDSEFLKIEKRYKTDFSPHFVYYDKTWMKTNLTCFTTRAPGGLTLTWIDVLKLPVVHLGVCHQLEKLWGPSPGPPWGHVYHLNNSESPTPKDVFWIRRNSYFLGPLPNPLPPPPFPGPLGPPWELPWTTLILHIRRYIWILHNLTVLLLDLKKTLLWHLHGLALGSPLPGPPMGATCTIWKTLNPRPLRMIPVKFG